MNRLHSAWQGLFLSTPMAGGEPPPAMLRADALGRCPALMLELARPADWELLGAVWRGVQTELGLPAPAIAVNGEDGFQLWFSLAEALPMTEGQVLLQAVCQRFLPAELQPGRLRLWPAAGDASAPRLPPFELQPGGERWAAFIAADLAPVFADSPWLDIPPGDEGQADLLERLRPITGSELAKALTLLKPLAVPTSDLPVSQHSSAATLPQEPQAFLLAVMNDTAAPLALRVDAAKALLTHASPRRARRPSS